MMAALTTGLNRAIVTDGAATLTLWQLLLVLALLVLQGFFLFFDGRRRGVRGYWLWALWGLTTCPVPFLLYWFLARRKRNISKST